MLLPFCWESCGTVSDYLVPALLLTAALAGLRRKEPVYNLMQQGAAEGLQVLVSILPSLIILLTAVHMLRASGAPVLLQRAFAPILTGLGIPPETILLVLIRPLSGSAALAVGTDLMVQYGVNSPVGRTAAVMLGSTETTFYTISVYFGAAGIEKTRYTVPAALLADLTGFTVAAAAVRLFYP